MCKKWKGYFTVEASFVLPLVLFLYLLIILSALFLYCRCAISQDNFLLGMRAGRFTEERNGCGEVIYGMVKNSNWPAKAYVEERILSRKEYYPFFPGTEGAFEEEEGKVSVWVMQKGAGKIIKKDFYKINPIEIIREGRRS